MSRQVYEHCITEYHSCVTVIAEHGKTSAFLFSKFEMNKLRIILVMVMIIISLYTCDSRDIATTLQAFRLY